MTCLSILLILVLSTSAAAATRLGLHTTQEELNIWRDRRTITTESINGHSFQSIYQNRILADANLFKNTHPSDGSWVGYTGAGCVPLNSTTVVPGAGPAALYGRGNGALAMRSAFAFLLNGDVSYAHPVRTVLLNQIAQAGTAWANTSKWCPTNLHGTNQFEIIPWLYRLLMAFDYLKAGGYTGFSGTELTNITNWFHDAGVLWRAAHINTVQCCTRYPGIFNTPQDLTCVGCPAGGSPMYWLGPTLDTSTRHAFLISSCRRPR